MCQTTTRNTKKAWKGRFITSSFSRVNVEPEFSLNDMFSGKKIEQLPVETRLKPPVVFTKTFKLTITPEMATLYITSLGIYQAYLNGHLVTDALFAPDYTAYNKILQYQTYEIASLLHIGENKLQVVVADGWYAGRVSVQGGSAQFGDKLALLADIEVRDINGTVKTFGTDTTFSASTSKWRYADIQIGEKQDLRLTDQSQDIEAATILETDYTRLIPQSGPQVRRLDEIEASRVWREGNAWIVDFGQVLVGRVRLTTAITYGQLITMDHSEVLDREGHFFKNIIGRNKDQHDEFIGRGQRETIEPDFTFHGFRYVRITGISQLSHFDIKAEVIFSDMPETGEIRTSDPQINRLLENVRWSQRGNMLSIPTDCPQRERVGWTGDMQVFASASTFYYDTSEFIRRWLKSVRADQQADGEIVDYSPAPKEFFESSDFTGSLSSAGWGDAIIMVPWTLYQRYGGITILRENFQAMLRWHNYAIKSAAGDKQDDTQYLWDTKFNYGDWMMPSIMAETGGNPMATSEATRDLIGTAFLAHTSELLAKIAVIIGEESQPFANYAAHVRAAFTKYYMKAGRLKRDYQGCYVLALAFKLVPEDQNKILVDRLVTLIHTNKDRLDTGFLSVPYLLDVLVEHGQTALAKTLFLQTQCPSWLYEVEKGATTIWETWSGIAPDGTVGKFSFNHYAMGCVLDWFIRDVIGLNASTPGYKTIMIAPRVDLVDEFNLNFRSPQGLITISRHDGKLTVQSPDGVLATLSLNGKAPVTFRGTQTVAYAKEVKVTE